MPDVDIDLIKPSPYQPRLFFEVDDLKEEIQRDGLLSALVVRKHDDHYELLDGERRLRTLKELGWKTVPVDIRDVDDTTAKRSVFKLNLVRQNYKTEEKARYFKKLAEEGAKAYQIGMDLNVDDHWVRAHLNTFLFPEDIQKAVWADQLSISTIREMEPVIGANIEEASAIAREALARKLTRDETRELLRPRIAEIEKARVEAARKALEEQPEKVGARAPITLETPEDLEKAGEALRREAKRKREEAMTPKEKAAVEVERKARAEAQALTKAERDEEKRQRRAEEDQRRQERAEKKARAELKGDKTFVQEALRSMPEEERIEVLGLAPSPGKPKEPKGLSDQFQETIKEASQLVSRIERLRADPGFEELDLKPFAVDLYMLADAFTEFSEKVGGSHGKKK